MYFGKTVKQSSLRVTFLILKLAFVARNSSDQEIDTKLGVEITILDVNDNPPQFQRDVYETTITEAAMQGRSGERMQVSVTKSSASHMLPLHTLVILLKT